MAEVQMDASSGQLGSVYFIQAGDVGGLIKIGFTHNVSERLNTLRGGSPIPLTLLAVIKGTQRNEHALHVRFAEARDHGEWFRPEAIILNEISRLNELVEVVDAETAVSSSALKLEVLPEDMYAPRNRLITSEDEANVVAELETRQRSTVTVPRIAEIIGVPRGSQRARDIAATMRQHGWLSSLTLKGAFEFLPAVGGPFPSGDVWIALKLAMEQNPKIHAHVGLGSAAYLRRFGARRPAHNTVIWCADVRVSEGMLQAYQVIRCAPDRYFGAESLRGLMVATPERIALEVALWPKHAGDLRNPEHWLSQVFEQVDADILAEDAERVGPTATSRLGYLAKRFHADEVYQKLIGLPTVSSTWFGTKSDEIREYDNEWGVYDSIGVAVDL